MSLRSAKQIIYGVFYLLFWGGLVAGFYFLFLKPAPSCFDNIQNQGETGIDCGGPCSNVCIPKEIKPIELVGRVLTFSTDRNHISFLAQIKNSNSAYAARDFNYEFSVYGEGGTVLKSLSGTSFIYGSEIKYILVPNVGLDNPGSLSRVDFGVRDPLWDSDGNFRGPPAIVAKDVKTSITENGLTVEGAVVNSDTVSFPISTIVAIFRGRFGEVAGASKTEVENLPANGSRPFSIIYPPLQNIDASSTRVFVYSERP